MLRSFILSLQVFLITIIVKLVELLQIAIIVIMLVFVFEVS